MKTLLVLRHAKSSWTQPGATDFQRPLNERGRRDAPRIGRLLRQQELLPEVILASAAARTLETAAMLTEAADFAGELIRRQDLYLAHAPQYIHVLNELDDSIHSAMVLGHNPGLQILVSQLAGHELAMPTAALAWFELPIESWSELGFESIGGLRQLWTPKGIDDLDLESSSA
jgi:phosphohistidine phosphatase